MDRGKLPQCPETGTKFSLTPGMVYRQLLRQTEGFVRSLVKLMGVDIRVPSYSAFSRRGSGLILPMKSRAEKDGPIHLVIDSTGLKIFGQSEWLQTSVRQRPNVNLGASYILGWILSLARSSAQI